MKCGNVQKSFASTLALVSRSLPKICHTLSVACKKPCSALRDLPHWSLAGSVVSMACHATASSAIQRLGQILKPLTSRLSALALARATACTAASLALRAPADMILANSTRTISSNCALAAACTQSQHSTCRRRGSDTHTKQDLVCRHTAYMSVALPYMICIARARLHINAQEGTGRGAN